MAKSEFIGFRIADVITGLWLTLQAAMLVISGLALGFISAIIAPFVGAVIGIITNNVPAYLLIGFGGPIILTLIFGIMALSMIYTGLMVALGMTKNKYSIIDKIALIIFVLYLLIITVLSLIGSALGVGILGIVLITLPNLYILWRFGANRKN